jgi:hypothetical protein
VYLSHFIVIGPAAKPTAKPDYVVSVSTAKPGDPVRDEAARRIAAKCGVELDGNEAAFHMNHFQHGQLDVIEVVDSLCRWSTQPKSNAILELLMTDCFTRSDVSQWKLSHALSEGAEVAGCYALFLELPDDVKQKVLNFTGDLVLFDIDTGAKKRHRVKTTVVRGGMTDKGKGLVEKVAPKIGDGETLLPTQGYHWETKTSQQLKTWLLDQKKISLSRYEYYMLGLVRPRLDMS